MKRGCDSDTGASTGRAEPWHRYRWSLAALAAILLAAATIAAPPRPLLVWNVSDSAPRGLYFVAGRAAYDRGDMVVARLPAGLRLFAARRRYLPLNVPLVKRIAALGGDEVCARGDRIMVNDRLVARRVAADARARELPWWSGCAELREGEYLLLMGERADSFDGRYFGPSKEADLLGGARLIWRR
ncbi:conjugative transfer signal peptidase TraF [Sphingopyxis sp. YR583]|uniref:S26 family signal peptidase n=1 Tax=Sphingopyxis sp. YR583 TaxID=1881047 RepID=UPI0008A7A455|nr:S26 family signal peptidase [Sphingopyxis sp. YR583]SEH12685.1 conjugative transfer signal peptidase TraF [Sphingopyxis sp. YR583]